MLRAEAAPSASRPDRGRTTHSRKGCAADKAGFSVHYKVWRSNKDKDLHLLCREGTDAFDALPAIVRQMGPWTGGPEGNMHRLRLAYRSLLAEQGFAVIYAHVTMLALETAASARALHPENTECPQCRGSGRVPMHHGLRDKACPRCGGRG